MFERIERTINEVRETLVADNDIRKLVYHDSNNALSMLPPDPAEVQKYIVTCPIFDMCETEGYDRNTMIQVELDSTDSEDGYLDGVLRINIVTNREKWNLVGGKIRPLQIANRVVDLVNGCKFSCSNELIFTNIVPLLINKKITGYALLFNIQDGSNEI
nr:MAG TPA: hypothetical protein [Caudoviricetes sp.]